MKSESINNEWFKNWFDTSYYHILYDYRDNQEATEFIHKARNKSILPTPPQKVLDLCCGKGRHSVTLNKLGYDVTGVDASKKSIEQAKLFESDSLEFFVHDMREVLFGKKFDILVNLFTSFGYFEDVNENLRVLSSAQNMLKKNGVFLLDYFNSFLVQKDVIEKSGSEKIIKKEDYVFKTKKYIQDGMVIKSIQVFNNQDYINTYFEKVQLFDVADFEYFFQKTGFEILNIYGDYDFNVFNELTSPRIIIHAQKI